MIKHMTIIIIKKYNSYPKTQELTVSAEGEAKKHLNQLKRLLKRIT